MTSWANTAGAADTRTKTKKGLLHVAARRSPLAVARALLPGGSDKPDWGDERGGVKEARTGTVWGSSWKRWMGSKKHFFFF